MATDVDERPHSANGLKRRQSDEAEQESKRQRVSPGKNDPHDNVENDKGDRKESDAESVAAPDQKEDQHSEGRRKSNVADEKKRSKRLFGALLGNLNQPSDRESKRRREIEDRRKAELQRQDNERLESKQRRLDRLAEHRRKAQHTVDEQNMRMRHKQMLNTANFLQTTTEPTLYYRPWDLRIDEEDRIDEQIREAEDRVEIELAKFEGRPIRSRTPEELPEQNQDEKATPMDEAPKHIDATSSGDHEHEDAVVEEQQPDTEAPAKSDDTDQAKNMHDASESSAHANVANNDQDEPAVEAAPATEGAAAKSAEPEEVETDGAVVEDTLTVS